MGKISHTEVVQLLLQLSVMLFAGRFFAEVARKFKQPAVIGEIVAGVLLGPTILGMLKPDWFLILFPVGSSSGIVLAGIVQVAVVMLLFIAGLEVDLKIVWQQGRQAVVTSLMGLLIPFGIGFIFPYFLTDFFGYANEGERIVFALFMGTAMAISALPVIVRILMDLNLFKSRIGLLVVASAMVDDIIGWLIFSVILGMIGRQADISLVNTILLTVGFAVFMLTIGRGVLNRALPWANKRMAWPGGVLALSLALCFMGAAFTEYIGIHAIFGAFIIGVALGDSEHFSERAKEIVHQFINNIFAPLFFVSIGLRVNFIANFDLMLTIVILIIAFAGKIIGSGLGARLGGFSWKESLAAGFGMNARGAMEIILGLIALENGLINEKVFVSLVIMALVTSMTSGPLMKWSLSRKWKT
ncbi:MAG TPA: cation:proton antiporter [Cyclobacteriaceae bacterium]|nr:cation:proton antiporter [Cyclobacteriaceae bacterium]HRJ80261.1 cation:proton antiporter [Cyclobacteriaceae bacterium]